MSPGAIFEKTIDLVQDLRLSELDLQWVDDAIAGNFCESDALPKILNEDAQEKKFFVVTLNDLCNVSKGWREIQDTNCKFDYFHII